MSALRYEYAGEGSYDVPGVESACCGERVFARREDGDWAHYCQGCGVVGVTENCEVRPGHNPNPTPEDDAIRDEINRRCEAEARELAEAECIDCCDTGWRVSGGYEVPCLCEAREPDYRDDFGRES